jgi:hypothetical protein
MWIRKKQTLRFGKPCPITAPPFDTTVFYRIIEYHLTDKLIYKLKINPRPYVIFNLGCIFSSKEIYKLIFINILQ